MICTADQKLGAGSIVTNGGIRDLASIQRRAPGFQVFAPGLVVSHGNATILEVGITVALGGLPIHPGDLLHGDENGLLTVPIKIAQSVLDEAQRVKHVETQFFDFMKSRSYSYEGMKRRIGIH